MADLTRVVPFGESALLVVLGTDVDEATNQRVGSLRRALVSERDLASVIGSIVVGYATLLVPYEPAAISSDELEARILSLADDLPGPAGIELPAGTEPEPAIIPVRYGGADGPDLDDVAARLGQHADDVIEMHVSTVYRVYLLGFAPGFAYLGSLPDALHLPRRSEPRLRVPAGSVAIANAQTAVYPFSTAGGWHILGATDARFWDLAAASPALLGPGDRVRFVAA